MRQTCLVSLAVFNLQDLQMDAIFDQYLVLIGDFSRGILKKIVLVEEVQHISVFPLWILGPQWFIRLPAYRGLRWPLWTDGCLWRLTCSSDQDLMANVLPVWETSFFLFFTSLVVILPRCGYWDWKYSSKKKENWVDHSSFMISLLFYMLFWIACFP